jgi:transposase
MERLHMNHLLDLIHRLRCGESERRIAQDLGLSRPTVHKYRELAATHGYLKPDSPMPDAATLRAVLGPDPEPPRRASSVEPYRDLVQRLVEQQVEITAIYQQLRDDYQYTGSYSAVRRFVNHLSPHQPEAVVRVHTAPGQDMQVDFGHLGWLFDAVSRSLRPAYVFVATLGYSRHQYAEIVFDQKVATWLALHQRAFESFGGVPRRVVPDNLKAAVKKALVLDPILGEAYRRMALHYGFLVSPTVPRTPRHKGKVENGVHYVKRNFWAGRQFVDSHVANQRLKTWVREVAGTREHGTTHQAPLYLFRAYEQAALLPLPDEAFTLCEIKPVTVHPDCHVVIDKSFYSVPYPYIGHHLTAHISQRMVELYCGDDLIASHLRSQQPGQWQTRLEDYPPGKVDYLIRTPDYCRQQAARLGPGTRQVVETLLADRPLDRLRSVQAILRLEDTVGPQRLEAACARAAYFGDVRYRRIKDILNAALDREPLPDAETTSNPPHGPFTFARSATEFFPPSSEVIQ